MMFQEHYYKEPPNQATVMSDSDQTRPPILNNSRSSVKFNIPSTQLRSYCANFLFKTLLVPYVRYYTPTSSLLTWASPSQLSNLFFKYKIQWHFLL